MGIRAGASGEEACSAQYSSEWILCSVAPMSHSESDFQSQNPIFSFCYTPRSESTVPIIKGFSSMPQPMLCFDSTLAVRESSYLLQTLGFS